MAMEYLIIPENKHNLGLIAISKHVLESITYYAIEEESDWYISPKTTFHQPVICKVSNNKLSVSVDLKLRYGLNINASCEAVQNKIYQIIQQMTDIKCDNIKVNVIGFVF